MIRAGVDLGSAHVALAVIDDGEARPCLIHAQTFALADRSENSIGDLVKEIGAVALGLGAEAFVIEQPKQVYVEARAGDTAERVAKRASSQGTALLTSVIVGRDLRSALVYAGVPVRCEQAGTIRSRVYRRAVRGAGVELEAWLCDTVEGWRGRERPEGAARPEHERDACVAALLPWAEARRAAELAARVEDPLLAKPRRKRATSAATGGGAGKLSAEERVARKTQRYRDVYKPRRDAERAARGLVPGQHKPHKKHKAHTCQACGGPRKGHVQGLPCPPVPASPPLPPLRPLRGVRRVPLAAKDALVGALSPVRSLRRLARLVLDLNAR